MSSLIKEINRIVSKECVLSFDIFNGCSLRKTDVLKTSILSEIKFEEVHYLSRGKKYRVYSRKRLFWHYCLQLSFVYKTMSQISFTLF